MIWVMFMVHLWFIDCLLQLTTYIKDINLLRILFHKLVISLSLYKLFSHFLIGTEYPFLLYHLIK